MRWRLSGHGPQCRAPPLFTPVVTPDETPNPLVEQECHPYASRNKPSPSLSTLCPSATTNAPVASRGTSRRLHIGGWWMCPSTIYLLLPRLFARVRKWSFSIIRRAHQLASTLSLAFNLVFVTFGSLRVPVYLVLHIVAY